jgi:protein CpxP
MKHFKKTIIATITLITVAVGASAYAQRGDGDHQNRMIERIGSKLDLDDKQNAALETFAAKMFETRQLMTGEGVDLRAQMTRLVVADTFDQGKALEMIDERAAALQAHAPVLVAAAAVFFDGLNAEQKETIQSFSEKSGHRH